MSNIVESLYSLANNYLVEDSGDRKLLLRYTNIVNESKEILSKIGECKSISSIKALLDNYENIPNILYNIDSMSVYKAKNFIIDKLLDYIKLGDEVIPEYQDKVVNDHKYRNELVSKLKNILKENGFNVKGSGNSRLYVYGDSSDSYDLMHDIKDCLFKADSNFVSDMSPFSPSRGSAWSALNLSYKGIRFKLSLQDDFVVIYIEDAKEI